MSKPSGSVGVFLLLCSSFAFAQIDTCYQVPHTEHGHPDLQGLWTNPGGDNPVRNVQIVQNEDYVVILSEYFSLVRIVRLNSAHLTDQGRKWMGDSIAHYDGDSLVILTINFRPEQSGLIKSSGELEITETYTPVSNDELLFSYTLTDPKIYRQPFTVEIPLNGMAEG